VNVEEGREVGGYVGGGGGYIGYGGLQKREKKQINFKGVPPHQP
jgi:hypothetical protein